MGRITLHPQFGVNPMLMQCFYCGESSGIALLGMNRGKEAPHGPQCIDKEPCSKCQEYMQQGIIFIACREPKVGDDDQNPYRTGGWCVIKEEAVRRMVKPSELLDEILKKRLAFVTDDQWDRLGLPRGEVKPAAAAENEGD